MTCKKLLSKVVMVLTILLTFNSVIFAERITKPTKICDLFEDRRLAQIVAKTLQKSSEEDTVTQSELDSVTSLEAYNYPYKPVGIRTLNGIEYLNNLEHFLAGMNDITDLSPLSNLRKLWELQLPYNSHLQDITPLRALTNMKRMHLSYTAIQDISALKDMKKLYWVCLSDTQVRDFSVLSGLPELVNCDVPIPEPKNSCTIM